jgi:hypothetical protein
MSDPSAEPFLATVDDLTSGEIRRYYQVAYEPGVEGQPGWLVDDLDKIPANVQWLPVEDAERIGVVVAVTVAGSRFVKDAHSPVVLREVAS